MLFESRLGRRLFQFRLIAPSASASAMSCFLCLLLGASQCLGESLPANTTFPWGHGQQRYTRAVFIDSAASKSSQRCRLTTVSGGTVLHILQCYARSARVSLPK